MQFWSGESDHCSVPGCLAAAVELPGGGETEPQNVTIDYIYDPLYRLTAADYDSGAYFHYTYDEVGNRLTQETGAGTNSYTYDIANRLIEVDGASYAWSANCNLLSDGESTYTYNHDNRLTGVVQDGDSYSYAYNGLGDRLQQTVNGEATNYTLDTVTGLTQVLDDGTNAYLYGLDRVGEQQPAGWAYHLPDALGSVRQLTDAYPEVTLARSYEPFGIVMASSGPGETSYSFTGEWADGTGLVHLRARYYAPWQGRFMSKDTWEGDTYRPLSYNMWLYAEGNAVNRIDPSGMYSRYVHWLTTHNEVHSVGNRYCMGMSCILINEIARWIADGDQNVDEGIMNPSPIGGTPSLHFKDLPEACRIADIAIKIGDPYLFGGSLHMIQDYYSHWREGYRWPATLGHLIPSANAGCNPLLGSDCHRDKELISSFYSSHSNVKADLRSNYPGENINKFSDDKLIDLWLYTYKHPPRGYDEYGYDPDYFFGFTNKDQYMIQDTRRAIKLFFLNLDDCKVKDWISGYEPPSDWDIRKFLKTGVFDP